MDITLLRGLQVNPIIYEEGFNPCFNGYYTFTENILIVLLQRNLVSILVLMDITLLRINFGGTMIHLKGFNPCFNGYYTFTKTT